MSIELAKIQWYYLSYAKDSFGIVVFRLVGETQNRREDLPADQFAAIAALLALKRLGYHIDSKTFFSAGESFPEAETIEI